MGERHDEYWHEFLQAEHDSLLADEFSDKENEDNPFTEFGWTVQKRRRNIEHIKIINDCHLMHSALAASCKCIYNVRTDQDSKKFQLESRACDWHYALEVFNGTVDKYF